VPTFNQFLIDVAVHGPGPHATPSSPILAATGAFTHADVAPPAAVASSIIASGQAPPASRTGVALIDTGATLTCVHEPDLIALGLNPVSTVTSGTAAGPVQQSIYVARLTFPQFGWSGDLAVAGVDLTGQQVKTSPPQSIVALLGRNILSSWTLVWNGPGGFWSVAT
jgi:hypothetical protein